MSVSNVFPMSGAQLQVHTQPPPLIDDPAVAEVFTDNLAGITMINGNVNLTFATCRADHTKIPVTNHRKVTSRLVMPLPVAAQLHQFLGDMLKDLEQKGIIKIGPVLPGAPVGNVQ